MIVQDLGAKEFQSTRPHGARRRPSSPCALSMGFQSTRPHGARHIEDSPAIKDYLVSIHAPARGATVTHC